MVTQLGTQLGTYLGTDLGAFVDRPPVVLPPISALSARHRYRASQAAVSGGNVTNVPNEGAAGGQLNVSAGTLAAPVPDARVNNQPIVRHTGTQSLTSSLAASEFTFEHDGSGFTGYLVGASTGNAATSGMLAMTFAASASQSGANIRIYGLSAGSTTFVIARGANPTAVNSAPAGYAPNTFTVLRVTLSSAGWTQAVAGVVVAQSASFAGALSASAPAFPLTVGRIPGSSFLAGDLAEILLFDRVLSAQDMAAVDAEMFATYGLHA